MPGLPACLADCLTGDYKGSFTSPPPIFPCFSFTNQRRGGNHNLSLALLICGLETACSAQHTARPHSMPVGSTSISPNNLCFVYVSVGFPVFRRARVPSRGARECLSVEVCLASALSSRSSSATVALRAARGQARAFWALRRFQPSRFVSQSGSRFFSQLSEPTRKVR